MDIIPCRSDMVSPRMHTVRHGSCPPSSDGEPVPVSCLSTLYHISSKTGNQYHKSFSLAKLIKQMLLRHLENAGHGYTKTNLFIDFYRVRVYTHRHDHCSRVQKSEEQGRNHKSSVFIIMLCMRRNKRKHEKEQTKTTGYHGKPVWVIPAIFTRTRTK